MPSIPGYRTLDRYILKKFLMTYVFGLLMMSIIIVVFDYVERVDDFTEMHAPVDAIIFDYYLNFIPHLVNQFSALFTFISVIFFTSKLAMQTEIVAILSGGVSFRRLMWPYMLGAGIIALASLCLSLWIIPEGQKDSVAFQAKYFKGNQLIDYQEHVYRQLEPGTFAYVRGYSPDLERVPFFAIERYEGSDMVEVLNAASATFDEESGRWTAPRYVIYTRGEDGTLGYEQFRNLDTLINLDARELVGTKGLVKTLTFEELNDFLAQQRSKGSDDLFLIEVERHTRFSYPFSTFILTLIGVAIASRKVRGGMGMHIGMGITLCFTYIMLGRVFEQIALGGTVPPWLGVWLPNIIFAIIALYVYIKAPK
ncbi:MAG: LptF/LptG family permease [Alistipes sp.]|nr:LptF/LptG family permease [Alistipes sp.]MBQ5924473.1 LptF/LptG family permease [Alistipes sp.]